jgi:hypothetical protein
MTGYHGPNMQSRAVRFTIVALLLASGIGAAFIVWRTERALQALEVSRRTRELAIERLAPAVGSIASAQEAYVDYGLRDDATLGRVAALIDRVTAQAAALRSSAQSPDSAAHLEEFWVALAALATSAAQSQQRLGAGEPLAAADLLLSTARPHVATISVRLREFREAEFAGFGIARASLVQRSWIAVGSTAVLWLVGLVALARVPSPPTTAVSNTGPPAASAPRLEQQPAAGATVTTATPGASPAPSFELSEAADLCTAISRLADGGALPGILERAARILDARGLIVWMGAGDELFPVAAYGYQESVISRLPSIKRRAENATAAAWRHGELRTVPADSASLGAIVAPMFDASGCVGVLAAEVRNGREADPVAGAITGILASQLALVLAAWPASSAADAAAAASSDRHAAAS